MTSSAELAKLKVAELKELLKAKDLPTNGVKQELIDRLLEAGGSAAAAGEPEEEAAEPCAGAKAPPSAPAAKPAEKAAPAPKPAANAEPAAPAAQTAAPTAAAAADEPSRADTQAGETEEEKRKRRAARFGVPLIEPAAADPALAGKIDKRRERFGKVAPEGAPAKAPAVALSAEEQARIDKRKERFGAVEKEAAGSGKHARLEGGAAPAAKAPEPEMSAEMKAKLEARAAKFGLNKDAAAP